MATVVKNFRIKSGLIVEGSTGTIGGNNILTESTAGDSYILNLVGGATLVKSVEATQLEVSGAGKLSVKSGVFDAAGSAAAAQAAAEATASADATSKANAAASSAISAAATDATTKVAAEAALRVSGDAASVSTAAADATTKADAAQAAAISAAAADATSKANAAKSGAEATAAAALSAAIATEVSDRNTAISDAVDSLVDGAPALLDTLNELAAAINDDANYTTTLTSALATKANSSDVTTAIATAKSEAATDAAADAASKVAAEAALRVSGDAASVATASADAATKANAAQAAAEATAQAALDDVLDATTAFTEINVNDEAKHIAATSASLGSVVVTAYEWPKADYRSGKFLVKIDNGTDNEISEILVTLDSSNNVAITEYAIVGTNGSRGTITASVSGANVQLRVDPVNDSTIKVSGTLIK
jgi:hypothetical protein